MTQPKLYFSEHFQKQLKKLKRKYPQIKNDILAIINQLETDAAISIGKSIYKIRIPSSDMQKGKSGSFRSYIYLYTKNTLIIPLCIYAKSKIENISENELKYHFDQTIKEIIEKL
ncbi:addiction module antitoxin [Candidatus Peregrinibacteria bacterium CG11_big_fil_rev_8_21_14_0_20_41_10]|nr:MAG: addiction module antitoxin [Candidatus Peregrinibacteria bacterium CG11_big_fil_rev_8_21_14_0_20_41_10]